MDSDNTDERPVSSPPELDQSDEAKQERYDLMLKVMPRLSEVIERLGMMERAMGINLPAVVNEQVLGDVVDLASDLAKTVELLEKASDKMKARIAYIKEVTMPARFDKDKVTTFNTERYRVTRTSRTFASIIGDQKDEAFQWLRDNEYGDLIKPTVNSSSLSAAAKEVMEKGMELPDDMFNTMIKDGVSITVKKEKRG